MAECRQCLVTIDEDVDTCLACETLCSCPCCGEWSVLGDLCSDCDAAAEWDDE